MTHDQKIAEWNRVRGLLGTKASKKFKKSSVEDFSMFVVGGGLGRLRQIGLSGKGFSAKDDAALNEYRPGGTVFTKWAGTEYECELRYIVAQCDGFTKKSLKAALKRGHQSNQVAFACLSALIDLGVSADEALA